MDRRRKDLGKRLQRARRAAGYKNQRVFAEAIGVHETSVARAESGAENVGDGVFTAIELGLHLPAEITTQFIDTGDEALLEQITSRATEIPEMTDESAQPASDPESPADMKNLEDGPPELSREEAIELAEEWIAQGQAIIEKLRRSAG